MLKTDPKANLGIRSSVGLNFGRPVTGNILGTYNYLVFLSRFIASLLRFSKIVKTTFIIKIACIFHQSLLQAIVAQNLRPGLFLPRRTNHYHYSTVCMT